MKREEITLRNDEVRKRTCNLVWSAPANARVEIKGPVRTQPQSRRMWAMLEDIAEQGSMYGKKYDQDEWKVMFLHALGRETKLLPSLTGNGMVPYGQSSSKLSVQEMSDMIEFMQAWGAENEIKFKDPWVEQFNVIR